MKGKLWTGLAALLCFAALSACSQGRNGGAESVLQQRVSKLFKKETQARLTGLEKELTRPVLRWESRVPGPWPVPG